jgi:exopolysaccharide biosynthesis polyprenyl glycosylphosphotransferase
MNISRRSLALLAADLLCILLSYQAATYLRAGGWSAQDLLHPYFILCLFILPLTLYIFDLYHPFRSFHRAETGAEVLLCGFFGVFLLSLCSYLSKGFLIPRPVFVYQMIFFCVGVFVARRIYDFIFSYRMLDKKTLIIGTGPLAREIAGVIRRTAHSGMDIVGFVSETGRGNEEKASVVGDLGKLLSLVSWYKAQLVVLALEEKSKASEAELAKMLLTHPVSVTSAIHLFEKLEGAIPFRVISDHYLLDLMSEVRLRNYLKFKRFADLLVSSVLLALLSPVLLLAVFLLSFEGIHRIFFVQERIGRDGMSFRLIKLRTMSEGRGKKPRVTAIGKWLRKYRVDEIPQLLNVLKGDMSLIGPRPEIQFFVKRCQEKIPFYSVTFAVRPGLTGWAQVKFRYTLSEKDYERKFCYNLYYLKNISPQLDLEILLKTVHSVLLGRGV